MKSAMHYIGPFLPAAFIYTKVSIVSSLSLALIKIAYKTGSVLLILLSGMALRCTLVWGIELTIYP